MRAYDARLMNRTCRIIEDDGYILLKRGEWYLHQHSRIAADFDSAVWGCRAAAMHFDTLELALLLAPYFECKVVTYYPKGKKR
jgi:hypothetical protein